jgi:hypothetical protein
MKAGNAMLTGAHSIVYSRDAEADRAFFRDVLGLPSVDVGGGWLIFGLPPSEVAVHPADDAVAHELYLICADVRAFVAVMQAKGIGCGEVEDRGWGLLTQVTLPGGGRLGVYQPRHARPAQPTASAGTPARKAAATRKRPAAARKAAATRTRRPAGRKAATTRARKRP